MVGVHLLNLQLTQLHDLDLVGVHLVYCEDFTYRLHLLLDVLLQLEYSLEVMI